MDGSTVVDGRHEDVRRTPRARLLVGVVSAFAVLLAVGIGVTGTAGAQAAEPTWSMPAEMQPGEAGMVTGEGFQPGSTVIMSGPGNVVLGEAVADQFGRIAMAMSVPNAMVSGPATMTLVGANIGGDVVTLTKSVNIGAFVWAEAAAPMAMDPQFTG